MTAVPNPSSPDPLPRRQLTVAEYAQLGEDDRHRYELQEGNLVVSPSPAPDRMIVIANLILQFAGQVPPGFKAIPDVDIDLELAPPGKPGFSRRPDLVVVEQTAAKRVRQEGGLLRASEVALVIEVVSPGSRRTDHAIKRTEYADAGIPHYWIVDLDEPVSLLACHLAEPFGYQDPGDITREFVAEVPFPVRIRLDELMD
ncbi:Uma2 family endonuclease [Saccharopolyspora sp. K220]|uniref:Uma2 family endonuclease n=1 Tax=Saccharopolyspora soli TaxID=2926618 RepID=UPI001F56BCC6|nr:Uma2 family endonuclease [Saccharopolyspora soli]MCI2419438.1 Uma2 family endonuclease [Saccharopolyspora soli]